MNQNAENTVTVSVIVCAYNQRTTIERCIEAIMRQESRVPFEVIIGDDGSRDGTREMCEEYAERYPDVIRLMDKAPNKGVLQNYYDCVRAARGEYIMECGGDDEWCPGRINLCLDIMEQHPDVLQVFTDVWFREEKTGKVRESGMFPEKSGVVSGEEMLEMMMHERNNQMTSYAITRTSVIRQLMQEYPQFFTGRKYQCEDKQLKTLIATKGNVYFSPERTFYYTTDVSSITHTSQQDKKFNYTLNLMELYHDLAEAIGYPAEKLASQYQYLLYLMMTRVFRSRKRTLLLQAMDRRFEYCIAYDTKSLLLRLAMSNMLIWLLSLGVFNVVRFVKKKL